MMATPEEIAALNEAMQLLEAEPVESTTSQTSSNPLVSVTNDDSIPAQREKLAIPVSTGKSKEAIGVQLAHDQVKRLSDKDVRNTLKGMKPTLATRPLRLWLTALSCFTARVLEWWFRLTM